MIQFFTIVEVVDPTSDLYKVNKKRENYKKNKKKYIKNTISQLKEQLLQTRQEPLKKKKMIGDRQTFMDCLIYEKILIFKNSQFIEIILLKDKVKMPLTPQRKNLKTKKINKNKIKKEKTKRVLFQRELWQKQNPKNGPIEVVLKLQQHIQNHTKNWKQLVQSNNHLEKQKNKSQEQKYQDGRKYLKFPQSTHQINHRLIFNNIKNAIQSIQ